MRIRQVKPSFWSDKVTARLPKSARLSYIGLWGLADDAGWIESFDIGQAAAELYPWEPVRRRERDLGTDVAALLEAGRVVIHEPCGCLEIPHLAEHQRIAGKRSMGGESAHRTHVVAKLATGKQSVANLAQVRNGRERNVEVGRGRKDSLISPPTVPPQAGDGEAKRKLAAAGLHLEALA